ncbi:restriction endonuclease subunit S [Arthrobacter sp. C9C5]|uniref:restriction endonuclease subunit S n=1 Tax=Arthrobacter sp. C9C5 TaxID=2735267 RepID=UPI0015854088|nr:restriction endonuclease subunit S [Arthrobacter sp. C9C5]NUU33077.1 restriction endonuclease subunit S [Arthrobacter sp. C9C5]
MSLTTGEAKSSAGPDGWNSVGLMDLVSIRNGQVSPLQVPYRSMVLVAPDHVESGTGRLLAKESASRQGAISGKYLVEPGDVIYSKIRPYLQKAVLSDFTGLCSADMYPLRPKPGVDGTFVLNLILSQPFTDFAVSVSARSGIPKMNRVEMAEFTTLAPPPSEQKAIGQVLTDVDSLIASLERLVAKKQAIKQGMMQQLLSGKTRLPGFAGEWIRKPLKELVQTPITDGPHLTPKFLSAGVPFLSVNNLVDGRLDLSDIRYVSKSDHVEFSKKCAPRRGDILLGKAASVGKVAIVESDIEFNIWSPIAMIRIGHENFARFVYYQLKSASAANQIALLTNTSSQGNIGMRDIEKLIIHLPPREEQVAIASALADADTDIYATQDRLTKAMSIKQGMMQELLTGRTRLQPLKATS